jgi:hypothetical protein
MTRFERMTGMNRVWTGALSLVLAVAGCTIVVPPPDDMKPPKTIIIMKGGNSPPPLQPLEAHALFVMNLHQSSANLAPYYVTVADALLAGLATRGINVIRWAVVPTYPGTDGMKLLFGAQTPPTFQPIPGLDGGLIGTSNGIGGATGTRTGGAGSTGAIDAGTIYPPLPLPAPADTTPTVPPIVIPPDLPAIPTLPNGNDIVSELQKLAATGNYDGMNTTSEAAGVVSVGSHLVAAQLPPDLGGLDGAAFFDRPRSLFLVIYLQPLSRKCSLGTSDCLVDGRSPDAIFNETNPDGTATWLHFANGGMPIDQVVHVALSTTEGESPTAFRTRCAAINGFPPDLFDVMEPSSTSYFDPLLKSLNAAHPGTGQGADLCELLGELTLGDPTKRKAMNLLVNSVASMAGPAPDTTTTTTTTTMTGFGGSSGGGSSGVGGYRGTGIP